MIYLDAHVLGVDPLAFLVREAAGARDYFTYAQSDPSGPNPVAAAAIATFLEAVRDAARRDYRRREQTGPQTFGEVRIAWELPQDARQRGPTLSSPPSSSR